MKKKERKMGNGVKRSSRKGMGERGEVMKEGEKAEVRGEACITVEGFEGRRVGEMHHS